MTGPHLLRPSWPLSLVPEHSLSLWLLLEEMHRAGRTATVAVLASAVAVLSALQGPLSGGAGQHVLRCHWLPARPSAMTERRPGTCIRLLRAANAPAHHARGVY